MTCRIAAAALGLVLSSALAPVGAAPSPQQVRQAIRLYDAGMHALQAGNLARAGKSFAKAAELFPDYPEARAGLGHVAMGRSDFAEARRQYETAIRTFSQVGHTLDDLRMFRYQQAQEEIRKTREEMIAVQTQAAQLKLDPVQVQRRVFRLQEEIRRLEQVRPPTAAESVEVPGELYFFLGNALLHQGEVDAALEAYATCRARSPDFAPLYNNLAVAFWKKGRLDEARAALDRAESLGMTVSPLFRADLDKAAGKDAAPSSASAAEDGRR